MNSKLVTVIFVVGISVIFSEAVDASRNQFNRLMNPRNNLLQDVKNQELEANCLGSRISDNVKDDPNSEILGGYRPLFPPFFPLKMRHACKKVYYDKEYYTRGIDQLGLIINENQERNNIAKTLFRPPIPLQQIHVNNNVKFYQQKTSSSPIISPSYTPSSSNFHYLPTFNRWPDVKIKDDHEVTFITYS